MFDEQISNVTGMKIILCFVSICGLLSGFDRYLQCLPVSTGIEPRAASL